MALDDGVSGTTELRVHGVSGTPPDAILQMPPPWVAIVAGDAASGFFRRWLPGDAPAPTEQGVARVEAYSWGGLTSGPGLRALWLLSLPFTLVDLAYWMLPVAATTDSRGRRAAAWAGRATLRLFALSLTVTALAAAALAVMDLTAWQCGSQPVCGAQHDLVGWLGRLARPQQRAAVGALVPAALVLLLWTIGRSSLVEATAPEPRRDPGSLMIARDGFFVTESSVQRLRRLHVTVATSVLAALVLMPVVRYDSSPGLEDAVLTLAAALAVLATALAVPERFVGRGGPDASSANRPTALLQGLGVAVLAAAWVLAMTVHTRAAPMPSHLPGLRVLVVAVFAGQLVLVPLLFAAVGAQHADAAVRRAAVVLALATALAGAAAGLWYAGRFAAGDGSHPGSPPWPVVALLVALMLALTVVPVLAARRTDPGIAAGGLAASLVATVAWLLALAFSAGIGLQTAQWLGHAVTTTQAARTSTTPDAALIVPPGYVWAGAAAVVVALCLVPFVAWLAAARVRRPAKADATAVAGDYPAASAREKERVATARAVASLTDSAGAAATVLVLTSVVVALAGTLAYLSRPDATNDGLPRFAAAAGSWVIVSVLAALVAIGYASVRSRSRRRVVGILWDVATFWPRAVHPLTPPCYAERAVLDLEERVGRLCSREGDVVVLSCHSQGSVLAVPTVLRLHPDLCPRLRLLLHGSPVRRLYCRWFPEYFDEAVLAEVRRRLPGRWRTLYRLTDPIGSWNLEPDAGRAGSYVPGPPRVADADQVDQEVADPQPPGDGPLRRHSDYWLDPAYPATVAALAATP
ncbi:MAG TPA: hypothetical protein VMI11_04820 [Actinomycetes bacterium]|nr:hypothetical protein [Actinomycetes bacterium]